MSLITRCPACTTLFKVVPDQLRVSDGWVRCGQCDEVFDANANLHQTVSGQLGDSSSSDEHPLPSPSSPGSAGAPHAESGVTQPQRNVEAAPTVPSAGSEEVTSGVEAPQGHDQDDFLEKSAHELSRLEGSMDDLSALDEAPLGVNDGEISGQAAAHATSPRYVQSVAPLRADSSPAMLSFLRKPKSMPVWHRAWVRAVLAMVALLLTGILLIQVVVHHRDMLVAREPALRPVVELICQWVDCRIGPPRQIESVVIDSSSFVKVRGDVYRLNVTVRNAAPIEVAMPAIELTLTDMQDQTLVRRVFRAADLGATSDSLAVGAELGVLVPIGIKGSGSGEKVSGYRIVAFYP